MQTVNPKLSQTEIDTIVDNLNACFPAYNKPQIRVLLEKELINNPSKDHLISSMAIIMERDPPMIVVDGTVSHHFSN
jgi:hypothetical protein